MKLNKLQISALANKIVKDIKDPYYEYNKAIRNSEEYLKFFDMNKECIKLTEICEKYNLESYDFTRLKSKIRDKYFESKILEIPNVSISEIEDMILIKTIEDISVDELVNKIVSKYELFVIQ